MAAAKGWWLPNGLVEWASHSSLGKPVAHQVPLLIRLFFPMVPSWFWAAPSTTAPRQRWFPLPSTKRGRMLCNRCRAWDVSAAHVSSRYKSVKELVIQNYRLQCTFQLFHCGSLPSSHQLFSSLNVANTTLVMIDILARVCHLHRSSF